MKKYLFGSAVALVVAAMAVYVCCLVPQPTEAVKATGCSTQEQVDPQAPFAATYRFTPATPAGKALVFGDAELLRDPALSQVAWEVAVESRNGALWASINRMLNPDAGMIQKLTTSFSEQPVTKLCMPDGTMHPQHHLTLRAELIKPAHWRWEQERRAVVLQELVIDARDGAVDFVTPTIPADLNDAPFERLISQNLAGLPARFCGSEAEQELQRMLFLMAAMHNAETTARLLPTVRAKARTLIETYAEQGKAWPDCWGAAAPAAQAAHAAILPYLQRVDSLDCFGSAELADFINSADFATLFGESWKEN